jgi:hypothetical protein
MSRRRRPLERLSSSIGTGLFRRKSVVCLHSLTKPEGLRWPMPKRVLIAISPQSCRQGTQKADCALSWPTSDRLVRPAEYRRRLRSKPATPDGGCPRSVGAPVRIVAGGALTSGRGCAPPLHDCGAWTTATMAEAAHERQGTATTGKSQPHSWMTMEDAGGAMRGIPASRARQRPCDHRRRQPP